MARALRIVVVDDSSLSRETLRRALELDPGLTVVGEARSGEEALPLVKQTAPDLITMDVNMPGMGGLQAIEALMRERPTPIVVVAERPSSTSVDLTFEALSRGALDLVPKSAIFGAGNDDVRTFVARIRELAAAGLQTGTPTLVAAPKRSYPPHGTPIAVGIGASTGGPRALTRLLSQLPKDFALPIVVVQHMAEDFFASFVGYLSKATQRQVVTATHGLRLAPRTVVVAPARQELFIDQGLTVRLVPAPRSAPLSPTVDTLFFSMATSLGAEGVGLLLTGMGDDGAEGLLRMRRSGARTAVQDAATSAVFGMPRAALELGAADVARPLDDLATWLSQLTKPEGESLPSLRVLVVDESPTAARTTTARLSAAGFVVASLDNPIQLVGTLRRNPADVVVLDAELAVMKPEVVIASLKGPKAVPVVLYGGAAASTLQRQAELSGAATWARNEGDELVLAIQRVARRRRT